MSMASVQSVDRAARILLAMGQGGERVTVTGLASELGVHKSTVSRLVSTLVRHELLEASDREEGLRPGAALRRLAHFSVEDIDLPGLAQPKLDQLSATTGETVTLGVAVGSSAITVAQSASRHVVGAHTWVGQTSPAYATSDGKVLLAFGTAVLPDELAPRTATTETDRVRLAEQLELIRERGWATSIGEFETGLNGVAVPVHDHHGRCLGAICLSGPEYRVPASRLSVLAEVCRAAAEELTEILAGGRAA